MSDTQTGSKNLQLWDSWKDVPEQYQEPYKTADGRSLTGIKQILGRQRMTEVFGPCGMNWGFETKEIRQIPNTKGIYIYLKVELWYKPCVLDPSRPAEELARIEGWGGKCTSEGHDDTFKMAETDALNRCYMALGHGADIYAGAKTGAQPEPVKEPAAPDPKPDPQQKPTYQDPDDPESDPSGKTYHDMCQDFVEDLRLHEPLLEKCEAMVKEGKVYFYIDKDVANADEYVAKGFKVPQNRPEILVISHAIPFTPEPPSQEGSPAQIQ